jgi:hypothetical protein
VIYQKKQSKNPTSSAKYKLALGTNLPRSGSTYLKRSAAYPKQFGKAVLKHHTKYLDSWFWMDSRPPVLGANVDDPTILLFFLNQNSRSVISPRLDWEEFAILRAHLIRTAAILRKSLDVPERLRMLERRRQKPRVLIFDVHNQICDLVMDIDSNNIIYLAKSNGFLTSIRHPLSSRSNGPISWLQKQSFMDGRDSKTIYLN